MRGSKIYALLFVAVLALAGYLYATGMFGALPVSASSATAPSSNDATTATIQAVIQKANQEQAQAFTSGDPTVMQDTAISGYYSELAQINNDMSSSGVTAIKLTGIDWGPINITNPTTATATTYESWQTTYSDGTTDQSNREQNLYTLIQEQGVWKIQSDDHPDSLPSASAGSTPPSGTPAPAPTPSGPLATQSDVSHNWAGYAATGGQYTGVTGTWTVPQSQGATAGLSSGATWVGIGGTSSRDLIQAGTEETTTSSGTVQYDAWVETLPRAARPISLSVRPGDQVTVSINQQSTGVWLVSFQNHTTGGSYQTTVQYQSSLSSAEWIEEAPSAGRRVLPIDNFGTVQFSAGSATENGKSVSIAQAGAQPISLAGPTGDVIAAPSVLTSDGQGFSVSQTSASTLLPQTQP